MEAIIKANDANNGSNEILKTNHKNTNEKQKFDILTNRLNGVKKMAVQRTDKTYYKTDTKENTASAFWKPLEHQD